MDFTPSCDWVCSNIQLTLSAILNSWTSRSQLSLRNHDATCCNSKTKIKPKKKDIWKRKQTARKASILYWSWCAYQLSCRRAIKLKIKHIAKEINRSLFTIWAAAILPYGTSFPADDDLIGGRILILHVNTYPILVSQPFFCPANSDRFCMKWNILKSQLNEVKTEVSIEVSGGRTKSQLNVSKFEVMEQWNTDWFVRLMFRSSCFDIIEHHILRSQTVNISRNGSVIAILFSPSNWLLFPHPIVCGWLYSANFDWQHFPLTSTEHSMCTFFFFFVLVLIFVTSQCRTKLIWSIQMFIFIFSYCMLIFMRGFDFMIKQ